MIVLIVVMVPMGDSSIGGKGRCGGGYAGNSGGDGGDGCGVQGESDDDRGVGGGGSGWRCGWRR